jgi:hypothetical protein
MNLLLALLIGLLLPLPSAPGQILPTKLQITVRDDLGNLVPGARVKLFKNEKDYQEEKNQVGTTLLTNAKGQVTFPDLESVAYYVMVAKGDLDNSGGGNRTTTLEAKRLNKVTIIIS